MAKIVLPLVLVLLAALLVRLPLYTSPFWRTPDTAEYLDVARNLAAGRGFTQSLKMTFFDNSPVVTGAFSNRLPVVPLLFSLLLRINNSFYRLQLCLLLVGALDSALFYLLLRRLLEPLPALLVSLLAALNPNLLINNRMLLSEQIYYLLIITAFLLFYSRLSVTKKYILLGIFSGLAFLTRPEGILLLIVLLCFTVRRKKSIFLLVFSFILVCSPYYLLKSTTAGSLTATNHSFVWSVRNYAEGLESGFNRPYPPPLTFIGSNLFWITGRVFENIRTNFIGLFGKAFLAVFIPMFLFWRQVKIRRLRPLILYALLNFFLLSAVWSMISEPERHLGLVFLFLLPLIGFVPGIFWQRRLWQIILTAAFCLYMALDIHRIDWARNIEGWEGDWNPWQKSDFYTWVGTRTAAGMLIASEKPNLVSVFTGHPSVLLPDNLTAGENLSLYTKTFGVNIIAAKSPVLVKFLQTHARYITTKDGLEIFSP